MKKNSKIRSNFVKESLLEYNNLADTLKENTESAVRDLLKETVLEQYAKILTEGEDEDYDVEEVDDTDSVNASEDDGADVDAADGMESDDAVEGEDDADVADDVDDVDDGEGDDAGLDTGVDAAEDEGEGWSEFDKYKVSDDEYDFSNAEDEEIVKVYKLLKDDDQVVVTKTDDKVNIKDNETGAEYLIDLGGDETDDVAATADTDDFGTEDDGFGDDEGFGDEEDEFENQDDEDMNESRIFEIALNEYNSNVGYTDNYQSKDVMTNPGMSEPGKNVNDWDKGVPKDSKKPWSGKKGDKSENQPFTAEKGKTVEEEEGMDDAVDTVTEAAIQELKTRQEHTANVGSTSRTDGDNGNRRRKGRSFHTAQNGQETGTGDNPYSNNSPKDVNVNVKVEGIMRKANKIFNENKQLKSALMQFKHTLEEAAVTNVNLGNIIKLVMENTTSNDEKKEIIARFGNEAKTVEASNTLFENISRDLKKKSKMNIDESREFGVNDNKINETQIYRSNDILNSLDLMHRICK
jgi:hypothetical protein